MDAGYDALEAAASSYVKAERDDEGRSHRSHRDRDGNRDRDYDRERDPRRRSERDERDYHRSDRDRGDRDRERDYRSGDRGGSGRDRYDSRGGERHERDGYESRRRTDDRAGIAEPMGGAPPRDDRRRYPEQQADFAAPMRGYDAPPPQNRYRRDEGPPQDRGRGRDDWRGGGGGGRGGRGGGGGGGGRPGDRRQQSPPRSPTPPGTKPLDERDIEYTLWDIRPSQFEGIGGMQAKMTGMFSYGPGRVPPPAHLGVPNTLIAGAFPPGNVGQINPARQAKRLYMGDITEGITEVGLKDYFTKLMIDNNLHMSQPAKDVISMVQINRDKQYAFLEFRTADEATAAMQFDNTVYQDVTLKIKRPSDFIGIDPALGTFLPSGSSAGESPNKLFVGGLPTYLNDDQVMELLKSFGELRSFNLVKETQGGEQVSKGFAFAEYIDTPTTDMAIEGLHNFQLGDRTLVVQRAAAGRNTGAPGGEGVVGFMATIKTIRDNADKDDVETRCMLMLNMVTTDELYDDRDYSEILEDITEECSKYGHVEGVKIPRPVPKTKKWEPMDSAAATAAKNKIADEENGVGRVYVLYAETESCKKAMKAIGGRQFGGRTILVATVSEEEYLGPAPPPPPPEDMEAAAADALKDIMGV